MIILLNKFLTFHPTLPYTSKQPQIKGKEPEILQQDALGQIFPLGIIPQVNNHLLMLQTESAYGIGLFPGLVYQFFYLRDVFLQVILKFLNGFELIYQSISFLFQIFHSGTCICNCIEQDQHVSHTQTHTLTRTHVHTQQTCTHSNENSSMLY